MVLISGKFMEKVTIFPRAEVQSSPFLLRNLTRSLPGQPVVTSVPPWHPRLGRVHGGPAWGPSGNFGMGPEIPAAVGRVSVSKLTFRWKVQES